MVFAELVVIVCIELQQGVAPKVEPVCVLAYAGVLSVFISIERAGEGTYLTVGTGHIQTKVQVEAKILEAMKLIVELCIGYDTVSPCDVAVAVKHIHRVGGSKVVRSEGGAATVTIVEPTVSCSIVDAAVCLVCMNGHCRVVESCSTYCAAVSLVFLSENALCVDVNRKVLFEEL